MKALSRWRVNPPGADTPLPIVVCSNGQLVRLVRLVRESLPALRSPQDYPEELCRSLADRLGRTLRACGNALPDASYEAPELAPWLEDHQ